MSELESEETKYVLQLRRERVGLQLAFTRTENKIRSYLQTSGSTFEEIDEALMSLCSTHDKLIQKASDIMCKIQDIDPEECSHLASYIEDVKLKLNLLKTDIENWRGDQVHPKDSAITPLAFSKASSAIFPNA